MKAETSVKAPAQALSKTDEEKARYQKMIEAASDKAPEKVRPYIKKVAPFIALAIVYVEIAMPYVVQGMKKAKELYDLLPETLLYAIIGFCMCFFGGVFPASIAAVEAWSVCGGKEAIKDVQKLYSEITKAGDASKKDDDVDADGDGVADVNQIDSKALLQRKTMVVLKAIDPDSCSGALTGLYTGWIGVLAVLKIQFAKTVTLGNAIGDRMFSLTMKLAPALDAAVPEEYKKWVPAVIKWVCKAIAITLAWWIQRVISAFHSSIRGGLMFSRGIVNFLHQKGHISFSDEDSEIDEYAGWAVAAVGFLFQLWMRFGAPFPFNILLLPVSFVEAFIVYSVGS